MTTLEFSNMQEGYLELVDLVRRTGQAVAPRDQKTLEVTGVSVTLTHPRYATPVNVGRKLNLRVAAAETAQLIAGISDAQQLINVTPRFRDFVTDGRLLGAYGPRVRDQLMFVVTELAEHDTSRRAVATIWRPDDLLRESADVPCTLSLQWLVRNGRLDMITTMRSNDLFLGVPYDFTMFTRLQLTLAWVLKLDVGKYVHNVGSMHIYERDLDALDELHVPREIVESPVPPMYPVTDRSTWRDRRDVGTLSSRWRRVQKFARDIVVYDPPFGSNTKPEPPESLRWYHDKIATTRSGGLYCSQCHYVLPRTTEYFRRQSELSKQRRARCNRCLDARNTEDLSITRRLRRYGLTLNWYQEQLKKQDGKCAICRREPTHNDNQSHTGFVIDHDHVTGQVRGLLCFHCNTGIGHFDDDVTRLASAQSYLRDSQQVELTP